MAPTKKEIAARRAAESRTKGAGAGSQGKREEVPIQEETEEGNTEGSAEEGITAAQAAGLLPAETQAFYMNRVNTIVEQNQYIMLLLTELGEILNERKTKENAEQ